MENALAALSQQLADAVEKTGRSVVAVHARNRFPASGLVWEPGVIVTADHAIKREEEITITLPDGSNTGATLAGRDAGTDIAALRIESKTPPVIEPRAADVRAGEMALAVGRSEQAGVHATLGVVSAVSGAWRTWRGGLLDRFVRLDLSLYPGSSGSAVVNAEGQLLGLATSGLTRFTPVAIPVSTVEKIVRELLSKGRIARGFLGLGLQPVSLPEHLKKQLSVAAEAGLIVISVEPGGPADKGGILLGDILLALDGKPTGDTDDVQAALAQHAPGDRIPVGVLRGGAKAEVEVTIGERPRRAS